MTFTLEPWGAAKNAGTASCRPAALKSSTQVAAVLVFSDTRLLNGGGDLAGRGDQNLTLQLKILTGEVERPHDRPDLAEGAFPAPGWSSPASRTGG